MKQTKLEREREREYLGEINETLAPPIKAAAAEVDGDRGIEALH